MPSLRAGWLAVATAAGALVLLSRRTLPTAQALLGLAVASYGFWLAWVPLGFIVSGCVLLADRVADQIRLGRSVDR